MAYLLRVRTPGAVWRYLFRAKLHGYIQGRKPGQPRFAGISIKSRFACGLNPPPVNSNIVSANPKKPSADYLIASIPWPIPPARDCVDF